MNPLDDINRKLMFVLNELKDFQMLSKNLIERSSYSSDLTLVKQVDNLGKTLAKVITLGKSITKMLIPNDKQFVEHDQDKNVLTNQRSKVTTSEEDKPHFDMTAPECSHNQDVGEIPDEVSKNKLQDSSTTSLIEPIFDEETDEASAIEMHNLARNLLSKGLYKTAKTLCEETIDKMRMSSGSKENNLSIANAMSTLSIIYWSTKEYEEVFKILTEVLKIRKRELGENHLTVAL